jgi:protein TonB
MPTPWEDSVRCEHCHDKAADDRRRFCEFCGRQLSVRQENPVENATAALDDLINASTTSASVVASAPSVEAPADSEFDVSNTPVSNPRPSARCESCGGPAGDADLCDACQRAFHAVIESRKPETSVDSEEDETEQDEFDEDEFDFPEPPPVQASPSPESTTGNESFATAAAAAAAAPPIAVTVSSPWAPSPNFSTSQMNGSSPQISGSIEPAAIPNAQAQSTDVPDRPPIGFAPLPPPTPPAAVAAAAAHAVAPAPEPPAPAPQAQAPTAPVRQPVAARELTRPMPRPRPVPPGGLPNPAPSSSGGRTRALFIAGALVVVALAVCVPLAQPWLASEEPAAAPSEEPPPQEASAQEAVPRHAPAPQRATPVVDDIAPDPVPPRPVRPTRPARPEPRREVASAPAPAIEPMAAAALPAPEPVAAPAPEPEPAAAPVGPFFETRQVNESPQVASRVEPRIPDEIQGPVNDVVIIRVLVSQTGHASLINVLRRSRTGPALDDAVVAAVKQWTFSPARKRGEAVSCWYHVGVPIQRAG